MYNHVVHVTQSEDDMGQSRDTEDRSARPLYDHYYEQLGRDWKGRRLYNGKRLFAILAKNYEAASVRQSGLQCGRKWVGEGYCKG
jgi:hypothetical protein